MMENLFAFLQNIHSHSFHLFNLFILPIYTLGQKITTFLENKTGKTKMTKQNIENEIDGSEKAELGGIEGKDEDTQEKYMKKMLSGTECKADKSRVFKILMKENTGVEVNVYDCAKEKLSRFYIQLKNQKIVSIRFISSKIVASKSIDDFRFYELFCKGYKFMQNGYDTEEGIEEGISYYRGMKDDCFDGARCLVKEHLFEIMKFTKLFPEINKIEKSNVEIYADLEKIIEDSEKIIEDSKEKLINAKIIETLDVVEQNCKSFELKVFDKKSNVLSEYCFYFPIGKMEVKFLGSKLYHQFRKSFPISDGETDLYFSVEEVEFRDNEVKGKDFYFNLIEEFLAKYFEYILKNLVKKVI